MKICVRYHLSLKGEEAAVKYSWFYGFTLFLSLILLVIYLFLNPQENCNYKND